MNKGLEALHNLYELEMASVSDKNMTVDRAENYRANIETELKRLEKQDWAIRDLMNNHIEFVVEKDRAYFKIKNSKGKEKSFTSNLFIDFWKEVLK